MSEQSYTTTFTVDRTPHEAYTAINDVRGWWEETIAGRTHEVGDEFTHWVPGVHYARIRVAELLPGKRVVWQVLDNWMSFIDDQSEWKGTEIRFDLRAHDGGTEVRFTHVGLTPADQCFDVCRTRGGCTSTTACAASSRPAWASPPPTPTRLPMAASRNSAASSRRQGTDPRYASQAVDDALGDAARPTR